VSCHIATSRVVWGRDTRWDSRGEAIWRRAMRLPIVRRGGAGQGVTGHGEMGWDSRGHARNTLPCRIVSRGAVLGPAAASHRMWGSVEGKQCRFPVVLSGLDWTGLDRNGLNWNGKGEERSGEEN
jgi:hypothetical protein